MPIYDFYCKKCKTNEEHICSINADLSKIKCRKGHKMEKLFPTGTTFTLKGKWYKTTKSY